MKYWLVAIISVLTFTSAYISSAVSFADKRFKWYKWIKKNVWIFVVINGSIALLSGLQVYLNDLESDKKEFVNKNEQNLRDLSLRKEYYKTEKTSDSLMSEVLAKYGLKFDSANNRLVKVVRDSSKIKVIIPHSPKLALCYGNEIERQSCNALDCFYKVNVCSYDAGTTEYKIQYDIVVIDSTGKYLDVFSGELLSKELEMSSNQSLAVGFNLTYDQTYDKLLLYLHGTYKNTGYEKNQYDINTLYKYHIKEKYSTILLRSTRDSAVKFIESNRK